MTLAKLCIENFTVFDKMEIEFCNGINVFIGENGTGKTHIMKILYSACQSAQAKKTSVKFDQKLARVFRPDGFALNRLVKRGLGGANAIVKVHTDKAHLKIEFHSKFIKNIKISGDTRWEEQHSGLTSTFIPAKEILSNSHNLVSAIDSGNVEFDDTYKDIIIAANVKLTHGPDSKRNTNYLNTLRKITSGSVAVKEEKFYLKPGNQSMLEFQLVAEGMRKIALLWQLIKNGTLENGSVLFWDEPEANINPKYIPALVDMLLNLQNDGVQVFIATHDYFFAKYLEVRRKKNDKIMFHALHFKDNKILCESHESFALLENNSILAQSIALYKEEVRKVLE